MLVVNSKSLAPTPTAIFSFELLFLAMTGAGARTCRVPELGVKGGVKFTLKPGQDEVGCPFFTMSISTFVDEPLGLVTGNESLAEILLKLSEYSNTLCFWWKASDVDYDFNIVTGKGGCIVDCIDKLTTVIPSFTVFSDTWRRSVEEFGGVGPFDFNWLDFSIGDDIDRRYLLKIIDGLEEQIWIWKGDRITYTSLVFILLVDFVSCLRVLANLVSVAGYPTTTEWRVAVEETPIYFKRPEHQED